MKTSFTMCLLAIAISCAAQAPSSAASEPTQADAVSREKQLFEADGKHDMDKLQSIFADDFVDINRDGSTINKQQILAEIPNLKNLRYTLTDFHFHPMGQHAYALEYSSDAYFTDGKGQDQHSHNVLHSVWVERAGKWQLLLHCRGPLLK